MLQPIVVGLDGSPESVAAADWAAREALRRGLPLRLVHAWEGLPPDDESAVLPELQVPRYWARRVLRSATDRLSERYPQAYISAEQVRRPPVPALVGEAEAAELLVLGHQGLGGIAAAFAGSVASAVVARVRRPTVLVRAGWDAAHERVADAEGGEADRGSNKEVLLALDLRHDCGELLDFAFGAAHARGAPLSILYAWHLTEGPPGAHRTRRVTVQRDAEWALAAVVDPWREKYTTVPVRTHAQPDRPVHVIAQAASGAGLLVVGRRIRHTAVGSRTGRITHWAIHHTRCPIAIVAHD
ncbi:universal stress protein [Streptomyces arenae]|nr:universal stress protein [Streptomyces arenae]